MVGKYIVHPAGLFGTCAAPVYFPHAAEACRLMRLALQVMEDLEQLKVLEHGYKMKTVVVHNVFHGVDKPGDIETLEHLMRQQGIH